MKTYPYRQDPGHGWVGVPLCELVALGIDRDISLHSYYNEKTGVVWLEEDCDAALWEKASEEQGIAVRLKAYHSKRSSSIRNLPRYKA